jgi:hypothetical protein
VLHGGDLICEGFVRALKPAAKARDAAPAAPAPAPASGADAAAASDAAPAAAEPAQAAGVPAAAAPAGAPEPQEPAWRFSALETVEAAQFYNAVSRTGIQYGPHFRMVRRTNIAPDTAAELRRAPRSPPRAAAGQAMKRPWQ